MHIDYDTDNVFAKVLRGELPCDNVYEDKHVLAIRNIAPEAPVHIVILVKGKYIDMTDFSSHANDEEILALNKAITIITKDLGLDKTGYRIITNAGPHSGQEIKHLHWHLVGGEPLGPILTKKD